MNSGAERHTLAGPKCGHIRRDGGVKQLMFIFVAQRDTNCLRHGKFVVRAIGNSSSDDQHCLAVVDFALVPHIAQIDTLHFYLMTGRGLKK